MINPGYYKHAKGGTYTVLMVAYDATGGRNYEPVVIYVSHKTGGVFTRTLAEFEELVPWPKLKGDKHPRFMRWPEPERRRRT